MADGPLSTVLNWLRGPQATPSLGLEAAPALPAYPSSHDADYARNYGFGDNSVNEDYLNNNKARVLGQNLAFQEPVKKGARGGAREMFLPTSGAGHSADFLTHDTTSSDVDLNKSRELQGQLRNVMMQAALAANRSPIAAMGFNPSGVVMDAEIKNPSLAGLYDAKQDRMYVPAETNDAIVHESTHRGLQKLREKYPEESKEAMRVLGAKGPNLSEEMVVRWLMSSKGGDPEGLAGNIDAAQRQAGIDVFDKNKYPINATARQEALRQLEELAIKDRLTRSRRSGPQ